MMRKLAALAFVFAVSLALAFVVFFGLNTPSFGCDYYVFYRAALDLPGMYSVQGNYSPAWVSLALWPVSLLGIALGSIVVFALNLTGFIYTFYRLRIPPILCAPLLVMTLYGAIFGNIEGLVILGVLAPAPLALIILASKPQMTAGVMVYVAWQAWREKKLIKTIAPLVLALALSVAVFGIPGSTPISKQWNASILPYGIPFAVLILWYSITRRNIGAALAVAPLISPYVNAFTGWAVLWVGLVCVISGPKSDTIKPG